MTLRSVADITLIGVFGAIVAISSTIPLSIIQGGGVFSLTWVVQTLTGILLGPYAGGLAALVGGVIGNVMFPSRFGPIAFVLPFLAAAQGGLIAWGYWFIAAAILGLLTAVWFVLPVSAIAWPVALFHIAGIIVIIVLGRKMSRLIMDQRKTRGLFLGWALTAYCADITRHMLGNIFYVLMFSLQAEVFLAAIPSTAIEQSVFAIASAIIGIPLLFAVRSADLDIPLMRLEKRKATDS